MKGIGCLKLYKIVFFYFQQKIAYCFIYATESMNYSTYMFMYVVNINVLSFIDA